MNTRFYLFPTVNPFFSDSVPDFGIKEQVADVSKEIAEKNEKYRKCKQMLAVSGLCLNTLIVIISGIVCHNILLNRQTWPWPHSRLCNSYFLDNVGTIPD